jgi:hypothetical protein
LIAVKALREKREALKWLKKERFREERERERLTTSSTSHQQLIKTKKRMFCSLRLPERECVR